MSELVGLVKKGLSLTFKWFRALLWLSIPGVGFFHIWYDGQCAASVRELQSQGVTAAAAHEQVRWLCGPLNLSLFSILIAILVVGSVQRSLLKSSSRLPVDSQDLHS